MVDISSTSHSSNSSTLHSNSHLPDSSRDSGLIRPLPRVQHRVKWPSRARVPARWNTPWCLSHSIVLISNFCFSLVLFRILFCGKGKENPGNKVVGAHMTNRSPFLSSKMKKNSYKKWLSGFPCLSFLSYLLTHCNHFPSSITTNSVNNNKLIRNVS